VGTLSPRECAALAMRAAALVDVTALAASTADESVVLWQDADSVAWLNFEIEQRDTGFHDHDGSAVGVHVIAGTVTNEGLPVGGARRVRHHGPGDSFSLPGTGIHRMTHESRAVTVHVYSPPLRAIGYYEIIDGLLQRTPGPPEAPSPPSPHLLAALTDTPLVTAPLARDAIARDAVIRDALVRDAVVRAPLVRDAVVRDAVVREAVVSDATVSDAMVSASLVSDAVVSEPLAGSPVAVPMP
jgi:hypothetical protein